MIDGRSQERKLQKARCCSSADTPACGHRNRRKPNPPRPYPAQRAKLISKWKAAYDAVHPETKQSGAGRGRGKTSKLGNLSTTSSPRQPPRAAGLKMPSPAARPAQRRWAPIWTCRRDVLVQGRLSGGAGAACRKTHLRACEHPQVAECFGSVGLGVVMNQLRYAI